MINIQTTLERSSRSDQCTTPARLPSPQAKVLTLSHLDSPVIGHDQCTVAQNEETDDFLRIPSLRKAPPDMENIELELCGEMTRL